MGMMSNFYDGGGKVTNKENGAVLPFVEMGGVYFLKLRIKDPSSKHTKDIDAGFARPA